MKRYFLSLFAGIGGFDLGAYVAGLKFDGHFYSEIDPYACKVMQARFPDAVNLGDICSLNVGGLPNGEWIVTGGFPCQDISVAGKGAGLEGSRSGLWFEYLRIMEDLRPSFSVIENVGALVWRGLDQVLTTLAEIGYDAEWQDIRASDVGAPHRRERIWIVAYPQADASCPNANGERSHRTEMHIDGSIELRDKQKCIAGSTGQAVADADGEFGYLSGESQTKRQSTNKPESGSKCNRAISWAVEPDVGRVAHGVPSRVDRLKCLGNSIVPQIAELIFRQEIFDKWRHTLGCLG